MSDIKTAPGLEAGGGEKSAEHQENMAPLNNVSSYTKPEKMEVCGDINHVANLNMPNTAELEKQIVRKLDMWMLPQLWILYMFNYLNRTNIAQARLNTFNEDLNLQDGDYQVCALEHVPFRVVAWC